MTSRVLETPKIQGPGPTIVIFARSPVLESKPLGLGRVREIRWHRALLDHTTALAHRSGAPLRVAQTFALFATAVMSILMMISAGSTIDSTLSSFSKVAVTDLAAQTEEGRSHTVMQRLSAWVERVGAVKVGRYTMVITVVLGSLPLFAGTEILKATTISGTMVLGLAPVFLLFMWPSAGRWAFHLAFWSGLAMGFWFAFGTIPDRLHMGQGRYAGLLGLNVWGTLLIFALFGLGAALDRRGASSKVLIVTLVLLSSATVWADEQATKSVGWTSSPSRSSSSLGCGNRIFAASAPRTSGSSRPMSQRSPPSTASAFREGSFTISSASSGTIPGLATFLISTATSSIQT